MLQNMNTTSKNNSITENKRDVDLNFYIENCKETLEEKDQIIIKLYSQIILENIGENKEYKILDIGTGDGKIIKSVLINIFQKKNVHIILDCIEPTDMGFKSIKNIFQNKPANLTINIHKSKIEDFIGINKNNYDFITIIHSLYFIHKTKWKFMFSSLKKCLSANGLIAVNLVSEQSEIYKFHEKIKGKISHIERLYSEFGFFYFENDILRFLEKEKHKFITKHIFSTLKIKGVYKCKSFLEFMFRLPPGALYNENIFQNNKSVFRFRSFDTTYIIKV